MKYAKICFLALTVMLALPAFAEGVVNDVIQLTSSNVGEDVIVAWAERSHSTATLSVNDILRMKDAKVPDKVIATLIRNGALAQAASAAAAMPIVARNEEGRIVQREAAPVTQTTEVRYVESQPSTTYVTPSYSYVYSDAYPVYYGGYYYPRSYYGGYYGSSYPSFGLSLNFGHGYYGGGYGHSYGGGYGGGYGHSYGGSYGHGGYSGYSSGGGGAFHSGGGGGGFHGGGAVGGSHGHR